MIMTFATDMIIEKDAIFIADAHFKQGDATLLNFLLNIPNGRQIFFMGDIFHLLIGGLKTSCVINAELLCVIAHLSHTNRIVFLEGNHDFHIQPAWDILSELMMSNQYYPTILNSNSYNFHPNHKNIQVYTYNMQPIIAKNYNNHYCILAHGDLWISKAYDLYRKTINNSLIIIAFKLLDKISCGIIYNLFSNRIAKRKIAEFSFFRLDFVDFMESRINVYKQHIITPLIQCGFANENERFCIIEGHFHLGKCLEQEHIVYNTLPSCYFHKKYFTLYQDKIAEVVNDATS